MCRFSYSRVSGTQVLALCLALTLALGCGGNSPTGQPGGQVRGFVLEVVGSSITDLDTLRVRDQAGDVWTFTGEDSIVGLSPSHLREHQLLGDTVLVTYINRGDTLVAVDIAD